MSEERTEAEADIDAAIAEAVEKTVANGDLRRMVTQYLIGAHRDLPPEERTGSVIDAIRKALEDEDR
jgi:hypothetical protein